jgi:hypothetical protein
MKIEAVTAYYDVGRANYDGRTVNQYIEWLNVTLKTPLPFTVFLDLDFDARAIALKPEDRIVRVAKSELRMFQRRKLVEEIVSKSKAVNRHDISFNIAEYGMIVMSKPDFLSIASRKSKADYLVWIDAGLSRFIPDLGDGIVKLENTDLEGVNLGINVTLHLAQRMRIKKFQRRMVGTTLAMMSAGDFIVAREYAEEFADRLNFLVEHEWLPNFMWDNEQVAIGSLLFRGGLPGARILRTHVGGGANTVSWLFGAEPYNRRTPLYVWWRLLLDEFRTRFAKPEDCYLPGDFPEAAFQKWVAGKAAAGTP